MIPQYTSQFELTLHTRDALKSEVRSRKEKTTSSTEVGQSAGDTNTMSTKAAATPECQSPLRGLLARPRTHYGSNTQEHDLLEQ